MDLQTDVLDVVEIHGPHRIPNEQALLLGLRLKDGRSLRLKIPSTYTDKLVLALMALREKN